MKFTLSWFKEYLDTTASVDEATYALAGLAYEHAYFLIFL